jgi:hypothetical protein
MPRRIVGFSRFNQPMAAAIAGAWVAPGRKRHRQAGHSHGETA